jgi:hypothetical protein
MSGHQLGASRIAAVLGHDNFISPTELWEEMVYNKPRETNPDMVRGIELEDGLLNWWRRLEDAKKMEKKVLVVHPDDERLGATLDATAVLDGQRVAIEAKCPRSDSKRRKDEDGGGYEKVWGGPDDAHPFKYRLQVIYQLGIAELAGVACDYGVLIAGPLWGDLLRFRVDPEPELFGRLVTIGQEFLWHVETRTPLPPTWCAEFLPQKLEAWCAEGEAA